MPTLAAATRIEIRTGNGKQRKTANGTLGVYLKQINGTTCLLAVDSAGKVARVAELISENDKVILSLRPDNQFLRNLATDEDGYVLVHYAGEDLEDDLEDDEVSNAEKAANGLRVFAEGLRSLAAEIENTLG